MNSNSNNKRKFTEAHLILPNLIQMLSRSGVTLTEAEQQVVFDAGAMAQEITDRRGWCDYSLRDPDGRAVTDSDPITSTDELVQQAIFYGMKLRNDGGYKTDAGEWKSAVWAAENVKMYREELPMTQTGAYTKYVNDNLERIASEGWVPVSFEEFKESEECHTYLYPDEILEPSDSPADDWELAGQVGVDRGMVMVCDPGYIDMAWKSESESEPYAHPGLQHTDGSVLYCTLHGVPIGVDPAWLIPFPNYEAVIEKYGKTANQLRAEGAIRVRPYRDVSDGVEFSYNGCRHGMAGDGKSAQLVFPTGRVGAGVVFKSGVGDGLYPVYVRRAEVPGWGERVVEARIVFEA